MNQKSLLLILSLFAIPLVAPASPLLEPASRVGVPKRPAIVERYGLPVAGNLVTCTGTTRQLFLMTPRVEVGEPIQFRLVVQRDRSVREGGFMSRISFAADYSFFIAPPAGDQGFFFTGETTRTEVPFSRFDFQGGNTLVVDFWMIYDRDSLAGYLTTTPGEYMVRVFGLCRDMEGAEQSQFVFGDFQVQVTPATEDNLRALEIMDEVDPAIFGFLQAQTFRFPDARRPFNTADALALERLVNEAPNAGLAPHALLLLSDLHLQNGRTLQALQQLQRIREDYRDHPLFEPAATRLLDLLFTAQRDDYAVPLFVELWTDPDRSRLLLGTSQIVQTYVAPHRARMGPYWNLFEAPGPDPTAQIDRGIRIELSEEVQQMLNLPSVVTLEEFERTGIRLNTE